MHPVVVSILTHRLSLADRDVQPIRARLLPIDRSYIPSNIELRILWGHFSEASGVDWLPIEDASVQRFAQAYNLFIPNTVAPGQ